MKIQRLLSVHGILRLLLAALLATSANLANANDLQTETHVIPGWFNTAYRLGSDTTGRFIAFVGSTSDNQFIAAQRLDESGAPIGEPIKLFEHAPNLTPRIAVSDGWGIAYQIFDRGVDGSQPTERIFVRETLEGPEKELAVGYERHRKWSLVYHYPLVGWLQAEPTSVIVDSLASVDLTEGTTLALETLPSSFYTDGNSVDLLRIADFATVVSRFNASTGLHEIWIRPLFSSDWTRISDPGLVSGSKVVTGGPWVAWYEHAYGAPETYSLRAYNHLTNDYRFVVARSDDTFVTGPYSATQEYLVYASSSWPIPVESYLYRFEDDTNHLLAQGVQDMGNGSASILGDMVAFVDIRSPGVTVVKFAECIDDDGDGVCLELDMCPTQDATGFDVDADGCLDSHDGLADLVGTLVLEGVIDTTMQNSLISKLGNATASADRDNLCAAINTLEAFKNQVLAQTGRKISPEAAELVIAYADSVVASLTASLPAGTTC